MVSNKAHNETINSRNTRRILYPFIGKILNESSGWVPAHAKTRSKALSFKFAQFFQYSRANSEPDLTPVGQDGSHQQHVADDLDSCIQSGSEKQVFMGKRCPSRLIKYSINMQIKFESVVHETKRYFTALLCGIAPSTLSLFLIEKFLHASLNFLLRSFISDLNQF